MPASLFVLMKRWWMFFPTWSTGRFPVITWLYLCLACWLGALFNQTGFIYDLGCSLGASSLAISDAVNIFGVKIIAVDNSAAMVSRFEELLLLNNGNLPIEVRQENIEDCAIKNASLVILNFTLQFIDLQNRPAVDTADIRQLAPRRRLIIIWKN